MPGKVPAPSGRSTDVAARREARLAREAALLEQGRGDIRAGRCISGAELEAWLDGLDGRRELPVPEHPGDPSHR